MIATYLTKSEMQSLMIKCRALRSGHKLAVGANRYTVIVDGKYHNFNTTTSLGKFLSSCLFPKNFRVFRNFDKGVTINLDTI